MSLNVLVVENHRAAVSYRVVNGFTAVQYSRPYSVGRYKFTSRVVTASHAGAPDS